MKTQCIVSLGQDWQLVTVIAHPDFIPKMPDGTRIMLVLADGVCREITAAELPDKINEYGSTGITGIHEFVGS